MKMLVVSDIHGSLLGAQAIQNCKSTLQPDRILCLGDILYHGPRNDLPKDYAPKEVIKIMNSLKDDLICVRGNCDGEVDQMVLEFPITADYNVIPLFSRNLFMTHGHVYGPTHMPHLTNESILLSGHTHIPTAKKENGVYLLNPGSISLPKENHPKTYGILTENDFTIYTLDHKEYMKIEFAS